MKTFIEELNELAMHPHDVAGGQALIHKAMRCVQLAHNLDKSVSDFLDAYRAFNNDECDDENVLETEAEMKRDLYALRLGLKSCND